MASGHGRQYDIEWRFTVADMWALYILCSCLPLAHCNRDLLNLWRNLHFLIFGHLFAVTFNVENCNSQPSLVTFYSVHCEEKSRHVNDAGIVIS